MSHGSMRSDQSPTNDPLIIVRSARASAAYDVLNMSLHYLVRYLLNHGRQWHVLCDVVVGLCNALV